MTEKENPARLASKRSMELAEKWAKEEWLALFADDATIEDPVGRSPLDKEGKGHRGKQAITAFYDRHIAPSSRTFEIKDSFACGNEAANVGRIHIVFPDGKKAVCDGVFIYRVNDEGKIVSIRNFWEWNRMLTTMTK